MATGSRTRRSAERPYQSLKRPVDVAVVALLLLIVVPVMILIAVLIKATGWRNPVWFTQMRTGRDGKPFRMYKFATMVRGADTMKHELAHLNVLPPPDFKIPNDPRITPMGRILRASSFDELPQLINVLLGEMSLVGPRPTSFGPDQWASWHSERLDVRPGLTGPWQVSGRGSVSFDERVRQDVKYVRELSFRTDVALILATIPSMVRREGM